MSVIRSHAFTLDDAALSGGAAILSAGSGLPRRITGAVDYEARVLALNPSGYWPLGEASGSYLDRTVNARHLTPGTPRPSTVPGPRYGESTRNGQQVGTASGTYTANAAAAYSNHFPSAGSPFTIACWLRATNNSSASNYRLCGSGYYGYWLEFDGVRVLSFKNWSDSSNAVEFSSGAFGGASAPSLNDGRWHHICWRYNGQGFTTAANWTLTVDGWYSPALSRTFYGVPTVNMGNRFGVHKEPITAGYQYQLADVAVWHATRLSDAEVQSLCPPISIGQARWTRAFVDAATVTGIAVPGGLNREKDANGETRDTKVYLSTDGVNRTEVALGADPAFPVSAGQTLFIDIEGTHLFGESLPFVGDALGGGPTLFYEEADPPPVVVPFPCGRATGSPRSVARVTSTVEV